MGQTPDRPDGNTEAVAESSGASAATPRPNGSRTVAAGRQFLDAVGSDLGTLALRLRRYLAAKRKQAAERKQSEQPLPSTTTGTSLARTSTVALRRFAVAIVVLAVVGTVALSGAMLWALHDLPLERPVTDGSRPALLLEAADGEALGRIGPLKIADAAREDFPDVLVQAVLSVEDRRFYSHFGFDPLGIARALRRNIAVGGVVEGGSTITQQLVKMRFLGNDRTFTRKLREALTAVWLDLRLGKDEILTRYLNSVYLGGGAHGMASATRLYFDKRPAELTLAEAALLTGLIKAPSQYSPLRNLATSQARAAIVLDAMVANGAIDGRTAAEAKARPATLKPAPETVQAGSWFADWVARDAAEVTGSFTRSVRVRTTLDTRMQQLAEKAINDALAAEGTRAGASQAALVALRPDGAVLAMVGGRDYRQSQFNRAAEANRHPGSAFKLFVYLAALRKGYSPNDTIDAGPLEIKGWEPENFDGREYGRVTLADAFARSINTAAVRLAMDVGLNEVISAARDLGIDARLPAVPSLALGAVEVSLLDLTGAFASVQAGRMPVEPWGIAAFGAEEQARLHTTGPPIVGTRQSLGRDHRPMVDLLRQVIERGTGRAAALNGFAAGKTGTSQNHRDAWFIGFNDALVVGVWVGNDDNTPMNRVVGGTLPASIWKRFMTDATRLIGQDSGRMAQATDGRAVQPPAPAAPQTPARTPTEAPSQAATRAAPQESSDEEPQAGQCDIRACAGAYRSFRASDCTYQSFWGPRRVCETRARGPVASEQAPPPPTPARAQAQCNVDVCARFYSSFDPSDCTYRPYGGSSRRLCER